MYCSRCGAQQPEEAKFCSQCGAVLQTAQNVQTPQNIQTGQQMYPPIKQRPKWLVPVAAGGSVLAAVIVLAVAFMLLGRGGPDSRNIAEPSSSARGEVVVPTPGPAEVEEPDTVFERYENREVMFAIDYPQDFELSEPNINNVLFGSGDECRVAAEYSFMTPGNSFIYSAEDFEEQMEANGSILAQWVGSDDVKVVRTDEGEVQGKDYVSYLWELSQNGKDYDGALYVFDSYGDFGCYTILTMVERGSEKEESLRESVDAMLQSFEITGSYEAEGYEIVDSDELELKVALQEDRIEGRIDNEDDHIMIVPAGDNFSHSSIRIDRETTFNPEKHTVERTLEGCSGYYLKYKDNGHFISQPTALDIGRYDFHEVDIQYTESGEEHVASIIIFQCGDSYWDVTMLASESNLDVTRQVLGDVLASICLDDEPGEGPAKAEEPDTGGSDVNGVIESILTKIEGTPGFIEPEDGYYEPLCSLTDADGNGVYEFIAVYKVKEKNDYKAVYDVYRIEGGEYTSLRTGFELYKEVGGNSGTLGLVVDKAGRVYLKIETMSPQGDRFNDTLTYTPLNRDQSGFDEDNVYLECHGTYGEEDSGRYLIGDKNVDRAAYEARQTEFMSLWTDLNLNMGPDNGGNNMSFEQIRTLDMNDYPTGSVG